jgi:hypothetical protein
MAATAGDRLRAAVAACGPGPAAYPGARLHALGWATVELDRAARELATELGLHADAFTDATDSDALGAYCRVARAALPGGRALAILEPATEGHLSASLARYDEGPVAAWYVPDGELPPALLPASPESPGPFGPERPAEGIAVGGVWRFLIVPGPGTIRA